jgi:hypothetical protein
MDFERQQFFWSRVRPEGEHLIWIGAKTPQGYGKMQVEGRLEYVHRVAWCLSHGCKSIKDIDHLRIVKTCEVNECCAPAHLASKVKKTKAK